MYANAICLKRLEIIGTRYNMHDSAHFLPFYVPLMLLCTFFIFKSKYFNLRATVVEGCIKGLSFLREMTVVFEKNRITEVATIAVGETKPIIIGALLSRLVLI